MLDKLLGAINIIFY